MGTTSYRRNHERRLAMTWLVVLLVLVALLVGAGVYLQRMNSARRARELADAREEAQRWYERLGGQVMNLSGDEPAVKQALADAGERYNAAGAQLDRSTSVRQFELARETALEGLAYVRAARIALGIDPGPELPALVGQRRAGALTVEREVDVDGHSYRAGPQPGNQTPYYYPGGMVQGRPVPAGWYSEPWWKTALVAGAWGVGSLLVFNALFSPSWGDSGYNAGYEQGLDYADQHGWDPGSEGGDGGGDASGADGGDGGADYSGDYQASDFGDYGGGDFGGGDFGGGDFGGDF